ncbi:unnamed protein product [Soboliphyme baturini]|uniref:VWFA domain-containing protein n=1 Tax=Soboliphyme baturini TaxID=241478 RepID=A0A183J2F7_9BILA|nr:unnamed protein product [Soboliphyme baturini]
MYPATMMHQHYDPTQREWFRRSVQHPSKVVLTSPNLDTSGLGYFVTMSHTLYDGKDAAMHHVNDPVVAVIGVDIPLNFWHRFLKQNLKLCREQSISCFLFDDHGFIVAYGNYVTGEDLIRRSEGMHITHKEPAIASEVLQYRSFVRKVVCRRYEDQTLQRVYIFNSSYEDVIRSNDGCLHFQIAPVPLTNVFLAVVNRSCHRPTAFCPCSVTDRRCLNCYRSEPTECECPCECPYTSSHCTSDFLHGLHNIQYPMCELNTFRSFHSDYDFFQWSSVDLHQCLNTNCMEYNSESSCSAVIGCEWCIYKYDHSTPLQNPYCASVHVCFAGVQGLSPLGLSETELLGDAFMASSTPIGPVAGGIMGVFVLLVVGVYWYRHLVTNIMNRLNSSSGSRLNSNDELEEEFHFDDGGVLGSPQVQPQLKNMPPPSQNGVGLLLASFERQNLVLPAPRARPRWRPGPRTESSDPGYSTMTGNCDDSEQTTTVDLLLPGIAGTKKVPRPNRHSAPISNPDDCHNGRDFSAKSAGLLHTDAKVMVSFDCCAIPKDTRELMSDDDFGKQIAVDDSTTTTASSEQTTVDADAVTGINNEFVIQAQIHSSA